MEQKKMNNKGFSLVELIVVIAIMAILVGALAPQLIKYIERSRQATDIQTAGAIFTAVQTAYADPMITEANKVQANALKDDNDFGKAVLDTLGGAVPSFTSKAYTGKTPTVTIDASGNIKVAVDVNSGNHGGKKFDITSKGVTYTE